MLTNCPATHLLIIGNNYFSMKQLHLLFFILGAVLLSSCKESSVKSENMNESGESTICR